MNFRAKLPVAFAVLIFISQVCFATDPTIHVVRVPDGGLQPQAAVDSHGLVHLIYFKGDPSHGDAFYLTTSDGTKFSKPMRVNSQAGSVIAIGTVRGPHLAIGRGDRVHVAWMGSSVAEPKVGRADAPMLYARLNAARKAFEPQRNVIHDHPGLDGGGSIAADRNGNVYIAWHAPSMLHPAGTSAADGMKMSGEADRHVWVTQSKDDGDTFSAETSFAPGDGGACGCCGMKLFANDNGDLFALYRSASELVHRDIYLVGAHEGKTPVATKLGPWEIGACVMSTAAMTDAPDGSIAAAFEQQGNIVTCDIARGALTPRRAVPLPGDAHNRKHPAIAVNQAGQHLVAWAAGTAWARGGTLEWQLFDAGGLPVAQSAGSQSDLPAWDAPAAVATNDGHFLLFY